LVPRGESLGMAFRSKFADQPHEGNPGRDLQYLAEQACGRLHYRDSFEVFGGCAHLHHIISRSLFSTTCQEKLFWTSMTESIK
jgi:hypothetical protein